MAEEEIKKEAEKEEKVSALQMLKNSVSEEDNNPCLLYTSDAADE